MYFQAELRSSVYLALENTRKGDGKRDTKGSRLRKARIGQGSERLSGFLQSSEGRLALNLVKEFLSFFDLSFTSSVLEPESDITPLVGEEGDKRRRYPPAHRSRQDLIELLGLAPGMTYENFSFAFYTTYVRGSCISLSVKISEQEHNITPC